MKTLNTLFSVVIIIIVMLIQMFGKELPSFHYKSKTVLLGIPLVVINYLKPNDQNKIEDGKFAETLSENTSVGWLSIGQISFGIVGSVGILSISPLSIGVGAVGIISIGVCAIGIFRSIGVLVISVTKRGLVGISGIYLFPKIKYINLIKMNDQASENSKDN